MLLYVRTYVYIQCTSYFRELCYVVSEHQNFDHCTKIILCHTHDSYVLVQLFCRYVNSFAFITFTRMNQRQRFLRKLPRSLSFYLYVCRNFHEKYEKNGRYVLRSIIPSIVRVRASATHVAWISRKRRGVLSSLIRHLSFIILYMYRRYYR